MRVSLSSSSPDDVDDGVSESFPEVYGEEQWRGWCIDLFFSNSKKIEMMFLKICNYIWEVNPLRDIVPLSIHRIPIPKAYSKVTVQI